MKTCCSMWQVNHQGTLLAGTVARSECTSYYNATFVNSLSTDAFHAIHQPTNLGSTGLLHLPVRPGRSPLSRLQLTSSIFCWREVLSMNIAAAQAVAHPENIIAAENATCRLQTTQT